MSSLKIQQAELEQDRMKVKTKLKTSFQIKPHLRSYLSLSLIFTQF